jgi:hypothetical protein
VHQIADPLRRAGRGGAAVAFQQPAQAAPHRALHRGRRHLHRFAVVDERPVVGQPAQPPPVVRVRAGHPGSREAGQLGSGGAAAGRCRVRSNHDGTQLRHERRQRERPRQDPDRQLPLPTLIPSAAASAVSGVSGGSWRVVVRGEPQLSKISEDLLDRLDFLDVGVFGAG